MSTIAILIGIPALVFLCYALDDWWEDERMHTPHPDLVIEPDDSEAGEGHVRH